MIEIQCDDTGGLMIQNLCWIFPIHTMNNIVSFNSLYSIELGLIKEFVLMLSLLNEDNGQYLINKYYCVGHTWRERNNEGKFTPTQIDKIIFKDWFKMKTLRMMTCIINEGRINDQ